ncbi:MAG: sigma-70 family RNA polymerase sigma factor, partial [Clostridia bacterium]|nr:sigma-70 family RNA polymerase sigma factor [Clostridia bacterium]
SSCGVLMEVSQEFYKEYYRDRRRERYLDELAVEHIISYHSLDSEEFCGEDMLVDPNEDVAEIVTRKLMVEKLKSVLPLLTDDERKLIEEHFFMEISQVELSQIYGVNQSNISRKISRILKKLRKFLEN